MQDMSAFDLKEQSFVNIFLTWYWKWLLPFYFNAFCRKQCAMRDQKQQEQSSSKVVSYLLRVLAKCLKGSIPSEHQNTLQNL